MASNSLIGEAGTIEVLKALLRSPMTFTELAKLVNTHTLQRRLREFASRGLVTRRVLDDRRVQYELAPQGVELAAKAEAARRVSGAGLEKLMGESYEAFLNEWGSYWAMRDEIMTKYAGRFVAVCGGAVCAVGDTLVATARGAERMVGAKIMYMAKVGQELAPYLISSPKIFGEKKRES